MDWSTGSGLDRWLDEATRGIRFGPDRRAVSCVFLWAAGIMLTFGMLVLWRLI